MAQIVLVAASVLAVVDQIVDAGAGGLAWFLASLAGPSVAAGALALLRSYDARHRQHVTPDPREQVARLAVRVAGYLLPMAAAPALFFPLPPELVVMLAGVGSLSVALPLAFQKLREEGTEPAVRRTTGGRTAARVARPERPPFC